MRRIIIMLFIIFFIPFTSFATEIDGYRGAKWGMSRKEVREVVIQLGLKVIEDNVGALNVLDTIMGYESFTQYQFTPISEEFFQVSVAIESDNPHNDVKTILIEKYGPPDSSKDIIFKQDIWILYDKRKEEITIFLTDFRGRTGVIYKHRALSEKAEKEQKKLILESEDKSKF